MVCECGRIKSKSTPTNSTTSNLLLKQLKEENKEIYDNPVVQELLKMIPDNKYNGTFNISFPIIKKFTDEDRHIIAGYASVEVIDRQDELIPISVLKEAWDQFRKNKDFYFGSLMHSNIPVIKVIDEYTDKEGQVWKSGVDDNGLFIVSEVRNDIQKGKQTWELIEKGKLTGYSIGGESLSSTKVCQEHNKCHTRVDKMELHEIAVVDRPANAPSVFKIIKRDCIEKEEEQVKPKGKELHIPRKMLDGIDTIKIDVIPDQVVDITTQNINDGVMVKGLEYLENIVNKSLSKIENVNKEIISKPFAGYKDFDTCVRQNQDKNNPEAYCGKIKSQVEKLDKEYFKEKKKPQKVECGYLQCPVDNCIDKSTWDKLNQIERLLVT